MTNKITEKKAKISSVKIPIGTLLLADDLILPQDLDFALQHQTHSNMLLGEILVRMGALREDDLHKTLQLQRSLFLY
ncbi:MAG TPA: hypothetical protein VK654_13480 [Nitrospirota bacterium]|nr:hypothetical protein [Nitrospirota bacterium]